MHSSISYVGQDSKDLTVIKSYYPSPTSAGKGGPAAFSVEHPGFPAAPSALLASQCTEPNPSCLFREHPGPRLLALTTNRACLANRGSKDLPDCLIAGMDRKALHILPERGVLGPVCLIHSTGRR